MSNLDLQEQPAAKRQPGRPPKQNEQSSIGIKKGVSSWTPANIADIEGKEDGFRYRKVSKDDDNVARKLMEGWEIVSEIAGSNTVSKQGYGRINDGTSTTTVREGTDWILARLPEEVALKRDEYFNNEAERRVQGLTAHLKKDMQVNGGNAPVHGEITISSRRGTQVIE